MTGGVVTIGETMALFSSPTGVRIENAPPLALGIGGAESNVAIGLRRLGVPAAWVGRVGDDGLGRLVARELRAEGLDLHVVVDSGAPTGLMVKERATSVRTRVQYYRSGSAGSRLRPEDVPHQAIAAAGVVHVTGITPGLSATAAAAVTETMDTATRHDVPVSFDVNHRAGVWREREAATIYRRLAAQSAVVFAGVEEARLLTGCDSDDHGELLTAMNDLGGCDTVLKLGADGCVALIDDRYLTRPAVRVDPLDTVGAGDAFVAGYLAEMVRGAGAERRLTTAVTCGALACLSAGDWEGLPWPEDLGAFEDADPVLR